MKQVNEAATGQSRRAGWKVFLTPSWIAIAILVLMFTYFAFTFLAPWQLGKGERKSETNHRLQAALEHDPVPVEEVLPKQGAVPQDKEWTHVSLQGKFEPSKEVLLHNRPVDSSPAFQILTPFETKEGFTVLVNRGWVPQAEGAKIPDIPQPPTGERTVTGFVRLGEGSNPEVVREGAVPRTQAINPKSIGTAQGIDLAHDYVQLDSESLTALNGAPGEGAAAEKAPRAIPLPQLDNGPHLSYGIQWIAFGILAPIGLAWAIRNELRERRLEEQERAAAAEAESADVETPAEQDSRHPDGESTESTDRLLADRYGRQRTHLGGRKKQRGERF
ncbi:hypothetical protein CRES_0713 [Corynebacterium resistens DSM 45100]|uniref:SURF1-like protein n=1 Tax=Corynebacterium resistens (strain DSM 45100 / JCM 12819 / GTC 2026 / SICGH 158) TaxID=662755 RepID=F8DZM2_CORRG|nr:SURF1 family protein [Corynebacterium resistens]AEI09070.1 hypothetical protein CRES_0713 [Corynebacterium resistens DSM 45100]